MTMGLNAESLKHQKVTYAKNYYEGEVLDDWLNNGRKCRKGRCKS